MSAQPTGSILIVDDDRKLTAMLCELLETEGFACSAAHSGERGLLLVEEQRPDLVVLDVMMPGEDGIAVLGKLRQSSDVPVIMLTAMGEDADRIRGLEAGADDYLAKPFQPRELLLRIRAVLKRAGPAGSAPGGSLRRAGPFEVQLERQQARVSGKPLELTNTELRILAALVERAGAVVTRDYLSRYAIGRELLPQDRTLDTHISNLRRKIAEAGETGSAIRNVRGSGYRLTVA